MSESGAYVGSENLEVMREAVNYNRYLLQTVRKHAPGKGRILDFGAGNGEFARPMKALGYDVSAVEPDRALRQGMIEAGINATAAASDLSDGSFAYIYTLNVLEHIEQDGDAMQELRAKLARGGTLLVYVPAFPVLYTSMDTKVGHIRRYTRKTLVAAVEAAGLKVESVSYVDSLGFFATLFFKYFSGGSGEINRGMLRLYDRAVFPVSRAFDLLTGGWYGKNLLLIARKAD
jgi:SAM-dependent methyltransferase